MSENIDFAADSQSPVPAETLEKIFQLAQEMQILEGRIETGRKLLEELNEQHSKIEKVDLPEIMNSVSMSELPLPDGHKLEVKSVVKANLPAAGAIEKARGDKRVELQERKESGLAWLRDNGGSGMIKTVFEADLGKGNDKVAQELLEFAKSKKISAFVGEGVHHSTLTSYIKEQIESEDGKPIPMDTFAVFTGSVAKITAPK